MAVSTEVPLPLTASLDPERNIGVEKVLYTGRINEYPLGKSLTIARVFPPWTVGLSPTSRCTRECFFCSHQERNKAGSFLSEAKMTEILEDLRNSLTPKGVILAGGGEPTNWESDLSRYINELSRFCQIGIDTNGTLLERYLKDETIWKLFYVTVPILGYDRDSYRRICERDQFAIIDRNLREILAIKGSKGTKYPYVNLKVAVNQRTYREFVPMIRYAQSLGADNIFVRCMNNFEGRTDIDLDERQRQYVYQEIMGEPDFKNNYVRIFAENLIRPVDQKPSEGEQVFTRPSHCWTVVLMHNMGIKPNGDVFLCVPTTDQPDFSIGNINHVRLTELWGGTHHLQVVEMLDRQMQSGQCDLGKCRHYRLNIVLEMARTGQIRSKPPDDQFLNRHGPFL